MVVLSMNKVSGKQRQKVKGLSARGDDLRVPFGMERTEVGDMQI